jgi:hypothetical protein
MAEPKKVKVTANLKKADIDEDNIDVNANGQIRLWGIDFDVKDGKATASVSSDIAKAMKESKLVK